LDLAYPSRLPDAYTCAAILNNGGFGGVSSDAAPAASFSPLFGEALRHQLLTYPASAQTTIWCKKRASEATLSEQR
jgi:hypothetical protein